MRNFSNHAWLASFALAGIIAAPPLSAQTITGQMNFDDARQYESAGDLTKARNRYNVGCVKRHAPSCEAYGVMNRDGVGGPVDLSTAGDGFSIACEEQSDMACKMLADLVLADGTDPQGYVAYLARETLASACAEGRSSACGDADRVLAKIGPEED